MYNYNQVNYNEKLNRVLKAEKAIQDIVNLVNYKLNKIRDLHQWHYQVGYLDALTKYSDRSTRAILKEISEINNELSSTNDDLELFEFHNEYLKGYKGGLRKIFEIYNQYKSDSSELRILVYTQDEELKYLLIALFSYIGIKQDEELKNDISVCVSNDINLLNQLTKAHDCYKFVITMNTTTYRKIRLDEAQKVEFKEKINLLSQKYPLLENKEKNLINDLMSLDSEWLTANFVYLPYLMSIEKVFCMILDSARYRRLVD